MKIYLVPTNDDYKLCASEEKKTLKSKLEHWVEKRKDGRIKSTLEKYIDKMEDQEEITLKMAYSFKNVELVYLQDMTKEKAKEKCEEMSQKYFKKNFWPIVIYGILTPVTFVAAPFLPILNWGVTAYFGYKFYTKYKGIKGYKKILNSNFVKSEENLDSILEKYGTKK